MRKTISKEIRCSSRWSNRTFRRRNIAHAHLPEAQNILFIGLATKMLSGMFLFLGECRAYWRWMVGLGRPGDKHCLRSPREETEVLRSARHSIQGEFVFACAERTKKTRRFMEKKSFHLRMDDVSRPLRHRPLHKDGDDVGGKYDVDDQPLRISGREL